MSLFKSAAVKEIERIIFELQMNLENNYKDAARDELKRLGSKLEEYRENGRLKDKDYRRFLVIYNEYDIKMTGYHH